MHYANVVLNKFSAFLSSTLGFFTMILSVVIGIGFVFYTGFSDAAQLAYNLYLSILAIVFSATLIVSSDRDNKSIQLKLDELIAVSESSNRTIGLENLTHDEVEKAKEIIETELDAR